MWRHKLKSVFILTGALVWMHCISQPVAGGAEEKAIAPGKEVIIYVTTMASPHLNPAIHSGSSIARAGAQIFATPLRFGRDWKPRPYLAERWEIAPDGLSVTLHLAKNARFHDGKPVTSRDVAFSVKTVKENHPFKPMFAPVIRVDTPDPHTAVLQLSAPHPAIELAMSSALLPILPEHIYGDGRDIRSHPANKAPVGCGPFRFVKWVRDKELILERNPDFFLDGYPYLDRIHYLYMPADEMGISLEGKGTPSIYIKAPREVVEKLDNDEYAWTRKGYEAVGPLTWLAFNLRKKPFNDIRVRQAVAYAIDRKFLAKQFYGHGESIATGPISPDSPFYSADVQMYDVDVKKANALLDQAGYPRDKTGKRFTVYLDSDPSETWLTGELGAFLRHDLFSKTGVEVKLFVSKDFYEWAQRVSTGAFSLTLDNVYNWGDPVIGVHRTYDSANIRPGLIWSNTQGYKNSQVDALMKEAGAELDFNRRRALYARFQKIIVQDCPVFYLWKIPYYTIYSKRLEGVNDSIWGPMAPLDRLYVKE